MTAGAEGGLAIVAGRGVLPRLIAEDCARRGRAYRVVAFEGVPLDWTDGHPVVTAAFEKPGRLFADLRAAGCRAVTLAGGMARPTLNPLRFDLTMLRLAPKVLGAVRGGDDRTLRAVAEVVEGEGFLLVPAQAIVDGLVAMPGVPTRAQPTEADRADAARAAAIVAAIGAVDVGQAAVVAQGICLGVESVQGTDELLAFVARTGGAFRPDASGARGVLLKAPKPGQDWRMDLPAIGPDTIAAAAAAGLAGIVVQAGGVLVLGREETIAAADRAGLFLWGRPR
ncbi:UDP-2,3-diacylglucosamine diphosphatase LpxI [Amaricoccus sp.]|uniref:LpxI family protein n=1 Tax=Amaricoccus sp. TaxID=1872485 RepID=UPI001B6AF822|nr:UDP-2,3-diacylglucosamine diphosphatase LpxI [Amaricoccus sp.]MBP7241697.1 UDP-2,3-diacylglucosamine diphosphatase LpxI [Amaricoccus sp.]